MLWVHVEIGGIMNAVKYLISILMMTAVSSAHASKITGLEYNSATKILSVQIAYEGQTAEHEYTLEWDECQTINGVQQIAARMIDLDGDEPAESEFATTVQFSLEKLACIPAELTARLDASHATVLLTKPLN